MNPRTLIKGYLIQNIVHNKHMLQSLLKDGKRFRWLYDMIIHITPELDGVKRKITQRIEFIINDRKDLPSCSYCGSSLSDPKHFISIFQGYRQTCGNKECCRKCIQESSIEWWQDASSDKIEMRNSKILATKFQRYGDKNYNNRGKARDTLIQQYGVQNPSQLDFVKQKKVDTFMKNYNVGYISQTQQYRKQFYLRENQKGYKRIVESGHVKPLFSMGEFVAGDRQKQYMWKCLSCGKEFSGPIDFNWFSHGPIRAYARCPECYPREGRTSTEEKELVKFLSTVDGYVVINGQKENKTILSNREIDILLRSRETNTIKFAFEFNGLYWHQIIKKNGDKFYHLNKTLQCENLGIYLIHIWEDEWRFHRKTTEELILDIVSGVCPAYVDDTITLDRAKYPHPIHIEGYEFSHYTDPQDTIRTDGYSDYHIFDCGTLVYNRIKQL